jgi:hypothetical protein
VVDIANHSVTKSIINLKVDLTAPQFLSFSTKLNGRYLLFNASLGERVRYLKYVDAANPRYTEVTLCSGCSTYVSSKYFSAGSHNVSVIAEDYAGNRDRIDNILFTVY